MHRISLSTPDRDLLPFFEALDQLLPGRRNAALLAAVRGGQAAARQEIDRTESHRAGHALDALLSDLE